MAVYVHVISTNLLCTSLYVKTRCRWKFILETSAILP